MNRAVWSFKNGGAKSVISFQKRGRPPESRNLARSGAEVCYIVAVIPIPKAKASNHDSCKLMQNIAVVVLKHLLALSV